MALEHPLVVEPIDGVGAEHEHELRREALDRLAVALDRVRVALVEAAVLVARGGMDDAHPAPRPIEIPGAAVGEVLGERVRRVLLDHPHIRDAAVVAVREREVDQAVDAAERERGFRAPVRQRTQPVAFAAGEHEAQHLASAGFHRGRQLSSGALNMSSPCLSASSSSP